MLKKWFKDSETILWARFCTFMGTLASILTFVEPALLEPILPPKWFPVLVLANGIATEWLRRRRADDL